jgi:hypothetical protein
VSTYDRDGFCVFDDDPQVLTWAKAASRIARDVVQDEDQRKHWLRHQNTWFVGVGVLPNGPDGSIAGVPLKGPWNALVEQPPLWHKAQVSVVYKDYPKQDTQESDANHRFRIKRCAAHVDGILLEQGRRYLREPHSFVLGLPLGASRASPLVVWPQSHILMGNALRAAVADKDPFSVDLTDVYKAARAQVFEHIKPIEVHAHIGQSMLLHRHLLHGVAPWKNTDIAPAEGRMIAYFRPHFKEAGAWLTNP